MNTHDNSADGVSSSSKDGHDLRGVTIQRSKWAFGGIGGIVAISLALVMLAVEHRDHLSGLVDWLPWLFLLACPLMHLFMHGGHGKHGDDSKPGNDK